MWYNIPEWCWIYFSLPRSSSVCISYIIIHMRHFSGKIKTRILLALLSLVWLRPYPTILPYFREISPLLPYCTVLKKSAISDHIALVSHRWRVCAEHFAHLSRVVRVMWQWSAERLRALYCDVIITSMTRCLLWRNTHIHDTLLAV